MRPRSRKHPDVVVRLRLSTGSFTDHATALREGRYDLTLLPVPSQGPALLGSDVITDLLPHMRLGLACRSDAPLAHARNVTCADLADRRFIDFPPGWGNRTIVDGLFATAGIERTVALEVVDTTTALTMVQRGLGLAFVPQEQITMRPGLTQVDLADPPPLIDLALALSRNHPPSEATRALRRALLARH
jgi:DNA-binding transcriptional LysR family regulator